MELVVEASVMAARAGESATAVFLVHNFGPDAEFDFFANDEKKYIVDWNPKS